MIITEHANGEQTHIREVHKTKIFYKGQQYRLGKQTIKEILSFLNHFVNDLKQDVLEGYPKNGGYYRVSHNNEDGVEVQLRGKKDTETHVFQCTMPKNYKKTNWLKIGY